MRDSCLRARAASLAVLLPMLVTASSPGAAQELLAPQAKQKLDAALTQVMRAHDLPSLAVAASIPGKGRYQFVGGAADLATKAPRHAEQPFRIASLTKTFVATAVLQLADAGKLAVSDKLAKWYPDFPNADKITVDDLLRLRSGIAAPSDEETIEAIYDDPTAPSKSLSEEMATSAAMRERFEPPDTKGVYTNLDYFILAGIVAKVTGADIGALITARIIDKLGLHQTSYPTDDSLPGGLHGYGWNPRTKRFDDKTAFNPANAGAAGAMISSLDDLDTYVRALCTGTLLKPATQAARMKGQVITGTATDYGEGVITGPTVCGHSGTIPGFSTDMYFIPKLDATMIISATRLDRDDKLQTMPAQKLVFDALTAAAK